MTNEEKEQFISKATKLIVDHLTPLGYPYMEDEKILSELKPMWIKLEESGLLLPGMTFEGFVQQAEIAFVMHKIGI